MDASMLLAMDGGHRWALATHGLHRWHCPELEL